MIWHWYERWGTGREISQWKVKDCSQTVCDRHWLHFLQSNPEVPIRKNKQRLVHIGDIVSHPVFVSTFPPVLTPSIFIWSIQRGVSTWEQWNHLDLVLLLFCHSLLHSHPLSKNHHQKSDCEMLRYVVLLQTFLPVSLSLSPSVNQFHHVWCRGRIRVSDVS